MRRGVVFGFFVAAFLLLPLPAKAASSTECTINTFDSSYELEGGAFSVRSNLAVDCGDLPDKHGIFITLQKRVTKPVAHDTPINLIEIIDEKGNPYMYEETETDQTITWKIGNPDQTITGVHTYLIRYTVDHVIGKAENEQAEIYWDILGTYWQMPIKRFAARLVMPSEVNEYNMAAQLFDGTEGSKTNTLSNFQWFDNGDGRHYLSINSNGAMSSGQGITLSLTFPATALAEDIYQPTFGEKYGSYLWLLMPILLLVGGFFYWRKYGKDPKVKKPEMVQYEPPQKLRPLELGLVENYGSLDNRYISATIVDLAVRGYLSITASENKQLFGTKSDWTLTLKNNDFSKLKTYEKTVIIQLFDSQEAGTTCQLSDQKNKFYKIISQVKKEANEGIKSLGLLDTKSNTMTIVFIVMVVAATLIAYFVYQGIAKEITWPPIVGFALTGIIGAFFAFIMRKRTESGAEMIWQLDGFKLYLGRAEKYRMEFYEKENIFEKYLPYAVAFGLTKQWLRRMHDVYQQQGKQMTVWPWYVGTSSSFNSFNDFADSVDSMINSFSSTVASSPSSSTSGGGGFSGGGGGGGGGGSW